MRLYEHMKPDEFVDALLGTNRRAMHTPGPWNTDGSRTILDTQGDAVAMVNLARPFDAARSDARLIAAAPDFLAALEGIASLGDKTLICVSDEHGQKCYSDGAHNAFAQCASLASAALGKARDEQERGKATGVYVDGDGIMTFDPTAGLAAAIAELANHAEIARDADARRKVNARFLAARADIHDALYEARRYFAERMDIRDGEFGPLPNTEMALATKLAEAMDSAGLEHD